MSFTAQIAKFSVNAQKAIQQSRRAITLELFISVIGETPVDKGYLRANWLISFDNPRTEQLDRADKSGEISKAEARELVKVSDGDQKIYLCNNLPYAWKAEFGGWNGPSAKVTDEGYSKQAPAGMVRKNVIRIGRIVTTVRV